MPTITVTMDVQHHDKHHRVYLILEDGNPRGNAEALKMALEKAARAAAFLTMGLDPFDTVTSAKAVVDDGRQSEFAKLVRRYA